MKKYLIDKFKNGKPKLISLIGTEIEVYCMIYSDIMLFNNPIDAWENFKIETKNNIKNLPIQMKKLKSDLKIVNKKLDKIYKRK